MKVLGKFLKYRKIKSSCKLDQETVFYLFKKIVKVKYGEIGSLNIEPVFYKEGKIFVRAGNSNWANEVWLNKKLLVEEVNRKIGDEEIKDIKIKK